MLALGFPTSHVTVLVLLQALRSLKLAEEQECAVMVGLKPTRRPFEAACDDPHVSPQSKLLAAMEEVLDAQGSADMTVGQHSTRNN